MFNIKENLDFITHDIKDKLRFQSPLNALVILSSCSDFIIKNYSREVFSEAGYGSPEQLEIALREEFINLMKNIPVSEKSVKLEVNNS